jgi:uncharacterized protein YmfQ (DUF2313 family)
MACQAVLAAQREDAAAAQAALVARTARRQSIAYYVAVAAAPGYTITIIEFRQSRVSAIQCAAGGVWEPGARQWLVERRRIGPVIRELERTVDPLFRQAGIRLP